MGNPYFGFKKDRAKTYALWERFNTGAISADELTEPYERLLIEEWRRCAELRIDVARKVGVRLSEEEFRALLEDSQQLLDRARPVIDRASTSRASSARGVTSSRRGCPRTATARSSRRSCGIGSRVTRWAARASATCSASSRGGAGRSPAGTGPAGRGGRSGGLA